MRNTVHRDAQPERSVAAAARPRIHRIPVEGVLALLGAVLALTTIVVVSRNGFGDFGDLRDGPRVAVFFVAIAIGQMLPVSLVGSRETAPMATASALAFAMTIAPPAGPQRISAVLVIAVTALAVVVGMGARLLAGARIQPSYVAIRVISVAFAALLFRVLPLFGDGRTLVMEQSEWDAWQTALAMVLVSLASLMLEFTLLAVVRSTRAHAPLRQTFVDEFQAAAGLSAALSATGTLIAISEKAMREWAIPLFLIPLVMTQFAVRRQATVRSTYGQTIRALSRLTELGGYTRTGHAERVASVSRDMGRDLGLSEREVTDLEYAALLHDIGQVSLREPIPGGATVMAAPRDQRRIASDGADIVRQTGVLDSVAVIIEAQTTPYRQVREFGEDLPMASRIIKVVNAYDDLAGDGSDPDLRAQAIERIHLGLGYEYDPRVVDSLSRVMARRLPT